MRRFTPGTPTIALRNRIGQPNPKPGSLGGMARPRQFDEDRAIDIAMRVFWAKGYAATSTDDLCEATGLKRSSLYNTFTSKHRLFTLALNRYMDTKTTALLETLDADTPIRDRLRTILRTAIEDELSGSDGCLVVNSIMELARTDREVARLLSADADRRTAALRTAIHTGQKTGDLANDRDPLALANFVTATVGGLRVTARSGATRETLESIMETAMSAL